MWNRHRGFKNLWVAAIAFLCTSAFGMERALAQQTQGVGRIFENIGRNISDIPTLISYGCYIGGFMTIIAGVFKIKEHVEDPRKPMKDGLIRLFIGACLIALPWVAGVIISTMGGVLTGGGGPKVPTF